MNKIVILLLCIAYVSCYEKSVYLKPKECHYEYSPHVINSISYSVDTLSVSAYYMPINHFEFFRKTKMEKNKLEVPHDIYTFILCNDNHVNKNISYDVFFEYDMLKETGYKYVLSSDNSTTEPIEYIDKLYYNHTTGFYDIKSVVKHENDLRINYKNCHKELINYLYGRIIQIFISGTQNETFSVTLYSKDTNDVYVHKNNIVFFNEKISLWPNHDNILLVCNTQFDKNESTFHIEHMTPKILFDIFKELISQLLFILIISMICFMFLSKIIFSLLTKDKDKKD